MFQQLMSERAIYRARLEKAHGCLVDAKTITLPSEPDGDISEGIRQLITERDSAEILIGNLRACLWGAHELNDGEVACRHCEKVIL
jgi:hypothetical protein